MSVIEIEPRIIPDRTEGNADASFIVGFQRRVSANPELYAETLSSLANAATEATVDLSELRGNDEATQLGPKGLDPENFIKVFFAGRHDLTAEYDAETEQAQETDETMAELMEHHRNRNLSSSQKESARDAIRRRRVEIFISRAVLWKQQREDALPSAG